jgi:hypothetical protein
VFREILVAASKHNIPSGFVKDFISGLPAVAKPLVKRRDKLRCANLNRDISDAIISSKRKKWAEKLEDSSFKSNPWKFWPLIKSLSGKKACPPMNQPITFGNYS